MAKETVPAAYENTTSFEVHFGLHVNKVVKALDKLCDDQPERYEGAIRIVRSAFDAILKMVT